jgi:hypothetical protein
MQMSARLLPMHWPRIKYELVLALPQKSLRVLLVTEHTQTPTQRTVGSADLPRG